MKNPGLSNLEAANRQLENIRESRRKSEELREARAHIIKGLNKAFKAVSVHNTTRIEGYGASDGDILDLVIVHGYESSSASRVSGKDYLDIRGSLRRNGEDQSVTFPMYRVSKITPLTDGGALDSHYEVSVADPEAETGYVPLALVEQSIFDQGENGIKVRGSSKVSFDIFKVHDSMTSEGIATLHETGLYVNPHAEAMLEEVHNIAELISVQAVDIPVAA